LKTNSDFYSAIKDCKSQTEDIDKKYKENDAEFAKVSADMSAKNNRRKKLGENVNSEKKKVCLLSETYTFLISQFSTA
jgi:peptidoglycan hydrolase CwlO-like protein